MSTKEQQRHYVRVPVEVEVSMASENNFYAGLTDNISEGGLFVATHQSPPIGAEVTLILRLPESEQSFEVRGAVCWHRGFEACRDGVPPGCGIQWRQLSAEATRAISQFVLQRETIFFEDAA